MSHHQVDEWGHHDAPRRQVHTRPDRLKMDPDMVEEFNTWLEKKGSKLRIPAK